MDRRTRVEAGALVALYVLGLGLRLGSPGLLYVATGVLVAASLFRRLRAPPAPLGLVVLEATAIVAAALEPRAPWGLALAGLAGLLLALPAWRGASSPRASPLEELFPAALALGTGVLAWRRSGEDPGFLALLGLLVVLSIEAWGPGAARTAFDAARRTAGLALLAAATGTRNYEARESALLAADVLAGLAAAVAAVAAQDVLLRGLVVLEPEALATRRRAALRYVGTAVAALLLLLVPLEVLGALVYSRVIPKEVDAVYQKLLTNASDAAFAPAYRAHPYTCFELNPDFKKGGEPWHSKDGFRLPELPKARRAGVARVAVLGGSTIYENDSDVRATYVGYLTEVLERSFPDHEVEVLNAGVGGYNSADTFARFHFKVLDYAPDLVVAYDGGNDVWPMVCEGFENDFRNARKPFEAWSPPGPLASFVCRHTWFCRALYFRLALGGRLPTIMNLTYRPLSLSEETYAKASTSAYRRNLEDLVFICRARAIDVVLCTCAADDFEVGRDPKKNKYALLVRGIDDLNQVTRDVALRQQVPLADLDKEVPRNAKDAAAGARFFGDFVHTTVRGNRARANVAGRAVVKALAAKLGWKAEDVTLDVTEKESYPPATLRQKN